MRTLTVINREHTYNAGRSQSQIRTRTIEVPDDTRLRYEAGQHILIVKAASGEDMAAFSGAEFYVEGVRIVADNFIVTGGTGE